MRGRNGRGQPLECRPVGVAGDAFDDYLFAAKGRGPAGADSVADADSVDGFAVGFGEVWGGAVEEMLAFFVKEENGGVHARGLGVYEVADAIQGFFERTVAADHVDDGALAGFEVFPGLDWGADVGAIAHSVALGTGASECLRRRREGPCGHAEIVGKHAGFFGGDAYNFATLWGGSPLLSKLLNFHSMLRNAGRLVTFLAIALFASPMGLRAMTFPVYDFDSLVWLSTDIVEANVSVHPGGRISVTINRAIIGELKPGDKIDTLTEFLINFRPVEDGQRFLVFLDRRPSAPSFFNSEASKSPFAIVPSGLILIDEWEHTHRYSQPNSPGPYVADRYAFFFEKHVPSREEDLALPTLAETESKVRAALKYMEPRRPLLDKDATMDDAPLLLKAISERWQVLGSCIRLSPDAILARLYTQVRFLQDAALTLTADTLSPTGNGSVEFVTRGNGGRDPEFTAGRVEYLIRTVADRHAELRRRLTAIRILLNISSFHSGPQTGPSKPLPIDNEWVSPEAGEIQASAAKVFRDEHENFDLRSLSLQFLPLDDPSILRLVKRVYTRTHSEKVRFAIESALLHASDERFAGFMDPDTSMVSIVTFPPPSRFGRCPAFRPESTTLQLNTLTTGRSLGAVIRWSFAWSPVPKGRGSHFHCRFQSDRNEEEPHCVIVWRAIKRGRALFSKRGPFRCSRS